MVLTPLRQQQPGSQSKGVRVDESRTRNKWKRFLEESDDDDDDSQWEDASLPGYEDDANPSAQDHSDVEMASTEEEMNLDARLDDKDAEVLRWLQM